MRIIGRAALILAALTGTGALAQDDYDATIVRTTYGIPHVTSESWEGIGYGVAYAYAQDNLCLLAEEFVTVAGERSKYFGAEASVQNGRQPVDNLSSDVFMRAMIDLPRLRAGADAQGKEANLLAAGYVAGYNRYLRDIGPQGVPAECRGKPWVRPITIDDMLRLTEKQMLLASALPFLPAIANAAPPEVEAPAVSMGIPAREDMGIGSNGWAFGGEVTADGKGLLIGNPHFPWFGPNRFWQVHATIPGTLDVMGSTLAGGPLPTLGFNRDIAWTHTVTAARHFTVYQLTLDSADPTRYMVDGESLEMTARDISVPMPEGEAPVVRTVHFTRYGPVIAMPQAGLAWTGETAFTMRDANGANQRALGTWVRIAQAQNVAQVREAVSQTLGIPWVNTIVADRNGDAMHADVTAVPNVPADKIAACATPFSAFVASQMTLLDGSRTECDWTIAQGTPVPGLMPASDQAIQQRRDSVTNSNDSYWLSNASAPHAELSPVLGDYGKPVSLRTRANFQESAAVLAIGPMTRDRAQALAFSNRSLAAEMAVDPLLSICDSAPEARAACGVLDGWDRRFEVDSRGAYLFATFWEKVRSDPKLWTVPFDAADPVHTPRDLAIEGARGEALLAALVEAANEIEAAGIALDAPWGGVQFAPRGEDRIAIHGGPGTAGILNMQMSQPVPGGIMPVHGTSYIQIVGFDEDGPVADAILSYSQSTDPASPHYGDQTRAYSAKAWHRLPFSAEEIEAQREGEVLRIAE
ncbi:penicillin acylase family protein [Alteriqipengyuania sp.]|uniref:penicillin acylase family protein n=1 Tax=Alteriqipengyuania sp. TaxID=2800692 RepID=UPI003517E74E